MVRRLQPHAIRFPLLKKVRCPDCGKKFYSETNVLQHMNQPNGSCSMTQRLNEQADIIMAMQPPGETNSSSRHEQQSRSDDLPMDIDEADEIYFDGSGPADDHELAGGTISDFFLGAGRTFAGGKTFMDTFWEDKYGPLRKENIFYPFASRDDWQIASWITRSGLSMAAIDSFLSLEIVKRLPISFKTARQLRTRIEALPCGPRWLCKTVPTELPTKKPAQLFYRDPIECLQALLSHPLFEPHLSFVPRKVWTSAARICRIYEDWLSGDCAWDTQANLPEGSTLLGVVLSSDKTNISVMTGNRMAHPLLISLANIDPKIRSKTSLHAYLLLGLLPIPKYFHKTTRVCSLVQDRLIHTCLDLILAPLKTAAKVGIMMSDPVGSLRYCFTPIASYIADTPEESLLSATSSKVSPVTVATSKEFGDPFRHPPRTATKTLEDIRTVCEQYDSDDYLRFLKAIKAFGLNGVIKPFWDGWPLCDPSIFFTPETLHHFQKMSWDHDTQWCINCIGAAEFDFRFALLQTSIGYRSFEDGVSKLKQVTGRDHRSVQRYMVGVIAGAAHRDFVAAISALIDFRYLAQASVHTDDSLKTVSAALRRFHTHKDAIMRAKARMGKNGPIDNWDIPKLELLQSVVPSIRSSGPIMQWTADVTEHAHVSEIKNPARSGNNQNYYSQISRHLDRSEKCFRFDLATYIGRTLTDIPDGADDEDDDEEHEPETERVVLESYGSPTRRIIDYFGVAEELAMGLRSNAPKPYRTFATATTSFRLGVKPAFRLSVDEAADTYGLPDLRVAISEYLRRSENNLPHTAPRGRNPGHGGPPLPTNKLHIWTKIRVQQKLFHDRSACDNPQTLRIIPPSTKNPYGLYDNVIVNASEESQWPDSGLEGHDVVQLRLVFRLIDQNSFAAYVQCFNRIPHSSSPDGLDPATRMHLLKRTRSNGERVGYVVPLKSIKSPVHLIPRFGKEADSRLTKANSYEASEQFWLNKYWSKECFFALNVPLVD